MSSIFKQRRFFAIFKFNLRLTVDNDDNNDRQRQVTLPFAHECRAECNTQTHVTTYFSNMKTILTML